MEKKFFSLKQVAKYLGYTNKKKVKVTVKEDRKYPVFQILMYT